MEQNDRTGQMGYPPQPKEPARPYKPPVEPFYPSYQPGYGPPYGAPVQTAGRECRFLEYWMEEESVWSISGTRGCEILTRASLG